MALKIVTISDGFESSTVPSVVTPAAQTVITYGTLTGTDISNGYLTLGAAPSSPNQTTFSWIGINQFYGTDFSVSGAQLSFLARLIGHGLQSGDEFIITYVP